MLDMKDSWAAEVRDMLQTEEKNENSEFRVKEVQYIQAEVKIIKKRAVSIGFSLLGGAVEKKQHTHVVLKKRSLNTRSKLAGTLLEINTATNTKPPTIYGTHHRHHIRHHLLSPTPDSVAITKCHHKHIWHQTPPLCYSHHRISPPQHSPPTHFAAAARRHHTSPPQITQTKQPPSQTTHHTRHFRWKERENAPSLAADLAEYKERETEREEWRLIMDLVAFPTMWVVVATFPTK